MPTLKRSKTLIAMLKPIQAMEEESLPCFVGQAQCRRYWSLSVHRDQRNFLRKPLAGLNDESSIACPDLRLAARVFLCRAALVVHPMRGRTAHHAGGGQSANPTAGRTAGFSLVPPSCSRCGTER